MMEPSESAFSQEQQPSRHSKRKARRKKLATAAKRAGAAVKKINQKINPAAWIDQLEADQGLADQLDNINSENQEDQARRDMRREAKEAGFAEIKSHLDAFLQTHPTATYAEWIEELHPENVTIKKGQKLIDHRFYVEDSDHRILWNETVVDTKGTIAREHVPAVSLLEAEGASVSASGVPVRSDKLWS